MISMVSIHLYFLFYVLFSAFFAYLFSHLAQFHLEHFHIQCKVWRYSMIFLPILQCKSIFMGHSILQTEKKVYKFDIMFVFIISCSSFDFNVCRHNARVQNEKQWANSHSQTPIENTLKLLWSWSFETW